ncbi:hypothetical protein EPUS_07857 [Endocarpon pusillum Z07020]|uniref:Heterokaryon incompatibility domain-containing protein n=1 Tax=Endocarpon pusillum (strain Z07020 / HMAS-L-300199) TaxID=1263415 RepID=U1GBM5_ENDPU|nr:uncharacterized protein EPUS_07857 [Endocarpon pusillum Z07020]ERF69453.1 hypothetical protein EPUS_07857 [Endocarpon pusillum Z07020]
MRLIKDEGHRNLSLVEQYDENIPHYAILSHTWGADGEEVTFKDLMKGTGKNKAGYKKIEFCRNQAARDGLQFFWVDTCCIDKSSSAELSEAINSMFRWYKNADKCYVYLSDVSTSGHATNVPSSPATWEATFQKSRWFSRGWTLQELIAPASVEFFSSEGDRLGSKRSLEQYIHEITGIAIQALRGGPLTGFKVEERFSWAKHRETKRQEDKAYSLFAPVEQLKTPPSSTVPFRRDVDFVDQRRRQESHSWGLVGRVSLSSPSNTATASVNGPPRWMFWIHASNADRIEQGYREIAERVKIPRRKDPKENIFELVARWLQDESNGTWMLVLDNLDDDAVISIPQAATSKAQAGDREDRLRRPLSAYLPQSQNGAILITTRTRSVATKLVESRDVIVVDPMTDMDAITLLKKKLDVPANDEDLRELTYTLEYIPLAIVQAAAYIQQKGASCSVRQYIEAFQRNEKQKTSLLNYEAGHLRRDAEAKNSIIITWQISFDDIREKWPSSADLLSLMSYFDRQGIPKEVLRVPSQEEAIRDSIKQKKDDVRDDEKDKDEDIEDSSTSEASDDDMFEEAVDRLRSYSFVSLGKDKTFEMHGLVQLATRKWLAMHREDEKWKAQFNRKLNAALPNGNHENWASCEMLFPHAKSRPRGSDRWMTSQYENGRRYYGRRDGKVLGRENVETSYSLGMLALTYTGQGRWKEAEELVVQVMETRKRVLGQEHPDTLTIMANLALTYSNQGRWKEAEELEMQVMETRKRVLGQEHPDTLNIMNNLALTMKEQGRKGEAIKLMTECVQLQNRVLPTKHPNALSSGATLAKWQSVES